MTLKCNWRLTTPQCRASFWRCAMAHAALKPRLNQTQGGNTGQTGSKERLLVFASSPLTRPTPILSEYCHHCHGQSFFVNKLNGYSKDFSCGDLEKNGYNCSVTVRTCIKKRYRVKLLSHVSAWLSVFREKLLDEKSQLRCVKNLTIVMCHVLVNVLRSSFSTEINITLINTKLCLFVIYLNLTTCPIS